MNVERDPLARLQRVGLDVHDEGVPAKGTVARAYELLESESVVETPGRRGTFIAETARALELAAIMNVERDPLARLQRVGLDVHDEGVPAKGTVARAYELLESESVVETPGRRGTFVAETAGVPGRSST